MVKHAGAGIGEPAVPKGTELHPVPSVVLPSVTVAAERVRFTVASCAMVLAGMSRKRVAASKQRAASRVLLRPVAVVGWRRYATGGIVAVVGE